MNSVSCEKYSSIEKLIALKRTSGESVSIVIPTLNEEKTVASIISIIKTELIDDINLVDELIVMDGGSLDKTVQIVEAMGVKCFDARSGLGGTGWFNGKGLALWRSQFVTKGSIIAFVDADIENFDCRFVKGLIGPFLESCSVGFVKGYYSRPIKNSVGDIEPSGGGRVTELFARPIFSRFYPDAAQFIQPLSGEYAFRRDKIENLQFYTGYGVETSLILDYLRKYANNSIVQVGFGERVHRNRPLSDLGVMVSVILQTVVDFAEQDGFLSVKGDDDYFFAKDNHVVRSRVEQEKLPLGVEVLDG